MSSLIDITLVIQVVHFVGAYWILSRIFLKPAYLHIMKIKHDKNLFIEDLLQQERDLINKRQETVRELTDMQKEILDNFPISRAISMAEAPLNRRIEKQELPLDARKQIIHEITQKLKKRIING